MSINLEEWTHFLIYFIFPATYVFIVCTAVLNCWYIEFSIHPTFFIGWLLKVFLACKKSIFLMSWLINTECSYVCIGSYCLATVMSILFFHNTPTRTHCTYPHAHAHAPKQFLYLLNRQVSCVIKISFKFLFQSTRS